MRHLSTVATLIALSGVFCSTQLHAQYIDFSFNGCELAFADHSGGGSLSFELAGLVFDENLEYDDVYAYPVDGAISNNDAFGYNAPYNAGNGSAGGDIDEYKGTIGAGLFHIDFNGVEFDLNLIDANYAAGNTYRILFIRAGSNTVTTWVGSPTGSDPVRCYQSITISAYQNLHLRDIIRGASGGGTAFTNYKRDRGSLATRIFTFGSEDIPRYGVDDAVLDVNCRVTGELCIPASNDKTVDVEGFADAIYSGELQTRLYFDDDAVLNVYGRLRAGTSVENSRIYFTSSSSSPLPGIWEGVLIESNLASAARWLTIQYAKTALQIIDNASSSEFERCVLTESFYHGMLISNSSPRVTDVTASYSHYDGVRIQGQSSGPWFRGGTVYENDGYGISIDDNGYAYINSMTITDNGLHGIAVFTNSWPYIDSSRVYCNGWSGIYTYENSYKWTTVRNSLISMNNWYGLHNVSNAYLRAYAAPPGMTDPEEIAVQPDSLGLNCVSDNVIENLYGDQNSIFEMARAYEAPDVGGIMVPHYQGDSNSVVYTSQGGYQGTMDGGSYAWVMQDWWNNNYAFNLPNGGAVTAPVLTANPIPECGMEDGPSGMGSPALSEKPSPFDGPVWRQLASDPDALERSVVSRWPLMTSAELNYGLFMLGRSVDSLRMEAICRNLLLSVQDADKRSIALSHLGKSLMSQKRYSAAVTVYDEIASLSQPGLNSRHTSAQGMAALMLSYSVSRQAGLSRLSAALNTYPGDRQLLAAWHLLMGGPIAGTPKRKTDAGAFEGFELAEAHPNPFNTTTTITFSVYERASLKVVVRNVLGSVVSVLADGVYEPGRYSAEFDGRGLAAGVYFCTLRSGGREQTKMLMLR